MTHTDSQHDRPAGHRTQFGIRMMMVVMLLICVAAAVYGGLIRGGADRRMFLVIGAAAPVGVMILLGLYRQVVRVLAARKRR